MTFRPSRYRQGRSSSNRSCPQGRRALLLKSSILSSTNGKLCRCLIPCRHFLFSSTALGSGPASRRSMRSAWCGSDAGATRGFSISTSRASRSIADSAWPGQSHGYRSYVISALLGAGVCAGAINVHHLPEASLGPHPAMRTALNTASMYCLMVSNFSAFARTSASRVRSLSEAEPLLLACKTSANAATSSSAALSVSEDIALARLGLPGPAPWLALLGEQGE